MGGLRGFVVLWFGFPDGALRVCPAHPTTAQSEIQEVWRLHQDVLWEEGKRLRAL